MTTLTPEMRAALVAAGWVFESIKRAWKQGIPHELWAEFEAITDQPIEDQNQNEWFWMADGSGVVWSIAGLCDECGGLLEGEEALAYGICDECA